MSFTAIPWCTFPTWGKHYTSSLPLLKLLATLSLPILTWSSWRNSSFRRSPLFSPSHGYWGQRMLMVILLLSQLYTFWHRWNLWNWPPFMSRSIIFKFCFSLYISVTSSASVVLMISAFLYMLEFAGVPFWPPAPIGHLPQLKPLAISYYLFIFLNHA